MHRMIKYLSGQNQLDVFLNIIALDKLHICVHAIEIQLKLFKNEYFR